MKYCVCNVLDQTWGMYDPEGSLTTVHKEAALHDTRESAQAIVDKEIEMIVADYGEGGPALEKALKRWSPWIVEVEDEQEFRARSDTW